MDFYIYKNKQTKKLRVHKGSCSYCNNGNGCRGSRIRTENGEWIGPYPAHEDARTKARKIANTEGWHDCRDCMHSLRTCMKTIK